MYFQYNTLILRFYAKTNTVMDPRPAIQLHFDGHVHFARVSEDRWKLSRVIDNPQIVIYHD